MDVISRQSSSTLNPNAPLFVPRAYREVEDFSDQWWKLVQSSPWFCDYWLQECFQEPEIAPEVLENDEYLLPEIESVFDGEKEEENGFSLSSAEEEKHLGFSLSFAEEEKEARDSVGANKRIWPEVLIKGNLIDQSFFFAEEEKGFSLSSAEEEEDLGFSLSFAEEEKEARDCVGASKRIWLAGALRRRRWRWFGREAGGWRCRDRVESGEGWGLTESVWGLGRIAVRARAPPCSPLGPPLARDLAKAQAFLDALKWQKPRFQAKPRKYAEKVPKIVKLKVRARPIKQPR